MKANELADIQAFKSEELTMWERNTTATMLRQQQAEIEALKQIIDANNLNQNIGQFVKPTNEPVAWTDGKGNYFDKNSFFPVDDLIPLYTHPVKELTDEEIGQFKGEWYRNDYASFYDLVRAILRKAQEK